MYRDPDRYSMKSGGGATLTVFGLLCFASGVGFIVAAAAGVLKGKDGNPPSLAFAIPFGLFWATVGVALMFARAATDIDARSRTVTKWWGLLVPFGSTVTSLDTMRVVTIKREVQRSDKSTITVYPVRIEGEGEPIGIEVLREHAKARIRAEEVAKFIGFGIEDSSTGEKIIREAGTLDMSLRDRSRASREPTERPSEQPTGSRVTVTSAGSQATFDLPARGLCAAEIAMIAFVILVACAPAILFFVGIRDQPALLKDIGKALPLVALFGLIWVCGCIGFILSIVKKATARGRLVVDPRELKLEMRSFMGTKTERISADELEELELVRPGNPRIPEALRALVGAEERVVARTDRATIELGRGLSHAELEWLAATVRFIVTS